ncbi:hypothetical protein PR048_011358 [Dryococelus australis]|uniref:Uncharacterized protein n=1 Tax=Dryococelus australis TaxID=614101 RepID=A0ABQ9HLF5_9NEOP|nr:hypothetical protein PR048_011358 [Dryococelus australis]
METEYLSLDSCDTRCCKTVIKGTWGSSNIVGKQQTQYGGPRAKNMNITALPHEPRFSLGIYIFELERQIYFEQFAKDNGFALPTSSAKFTQLNGQAENTTSRQYPDLDEFWAKDQRLKKRNKLHFDQRHGAKELPQLKFGGQVWIPVLNNYGEVYTKAPFSLSYIIQTAQDKQGSYIPTVDNSCRAVTEERRRKKRREVAEAAVSSKATHRLQNREANITCKLSKSRGGGDGGGGGGGGDVGGVCGGDGGGGGGDCGGSVR